MFIELALLICDFLAFKGMSRDGLGIGIPQLAIASL